MKDFVSNYRLNLCDCHEHDTLNSYDIEQIYEIYSADGGLEPGV